MAKHDVKTFSWDVPENAYTEAECIRLKAESARQKELIKALEADNARLQGRVDRYVEILEAKNTRIARLREKIADMVESDV